MHDPIAVLAPEWQDIGDLLTNLWYMVALVVFLATNMLVGHILIPSMVASHHLPERVQRVRPIFYAAAIASFGLAMYILSRVVELAGVFRRFWDIYWI